MAALKLVQDDYYHSDVSDCEEPVIAKPSEPEIPEQEYLDFADNVMEKIGDDPRLIAEKYDIHVANLLGGTLGEATREEIRNRLAAVFKLRDTEPWEEAGFGD